MLKKILTLIAVAALLVMSAETTMWWLQFIAAAVFTTICLAARYSHEN